MEDPHRHQRDHHQRTNHRITHHQRALFHYAAAKEFQRYLAVLREGESSARRHFLQCMDAIAGMPAESRPHYYFAYGSLLNEEQIAATIPNAEREGVAFLPNYRLVFDKHSKKWQGDAANITKDPTSVVWGFVYRVNDEEKIATRPLRTFSFQAMSACDHDCGPPPEYVKTVVNGARARGLPGAYIETIAQERTTTNREPSAR